jgi:fatty acid desaturase
MPVTTHHPSLHERVENATSAGDLRLIYGLGIPLVAMVGFIAAAAVAGQVWLIAPLMLLVLGMTAIVLVGFAQMLDDGDDRR